MTHDKKTESRRRPPRWLGALSALAAVGALLGAVEQRAEACGGGNGSYADGLAEAALIGFGTLALDASFSIHDLVVDDSSRAYGVVETALTAPQVALGVAVLANGDVESSAGLAAAALVYTGWTAALAIHGIHAAVKADPVRPSEAPPVPRSGPPGMSSSFRMSAAPTALVDSRGGLAPGVGLVGAF
jgi:hypothetical protein